MKPGAGEHVTWDAMTETLEGPVDATLKPIVAPVVLHAAATSQDSTQQVPWRAMAVITWFILCGLFVGFVGEKLTYSGGTEPVAVAGMR